MTRNELQIDMEARAKQAEAILGDPAKADEFKGLTDKIGVIGEQIRAMDKAEAEVRAVKDAEARAPKPVVTEDRGGWKGAASQLISLVDGNIRSGSLHLGDRETRAITSNGTGINTEPGLVKALVDGGMLRSKVSVFTGKNAQTVVPVFSPHLALPVGSVPGATGTASDATAVLTGKTLTLKPWYATLQVSRGALVSSDVGSYMNGIMEEAFGGAIDKAICVGAGSGSDALGVFIADAAGVPTSSDIVMASGTVASGPLWADFLNLAMQMLSLGGDRAGLAIVVHPAVFKYALGQAASGFDAMKIEYLTKGTILGIPVILSSYAQSALTNDFYVAVGGNFKHYALAVAQELVIDEIKTVGSDNITFQAFMYMQGTPLIGSSFRRLQTTT